MKERVLTGRKFLLSLSALLALVFLVAFFSPAAAASRQIALIPAGGKVLLLEEWGGDCLFAYSGGSTGAGAVVVLDKATGEPKGSVSLSLFWAGLRDGSLFVAEDSNGEALLTQLSLPSLTTVSSRPLPAAADSFLLFDCNGQGRFYYSQDGNFLYTATSNQDIQPLARQDWLFPTFFGDHPGRNLLCRHQFPLFLGIFGNTGGRYLVQTSRGGSALEPAGGNLLCHRFRQDLSVPDGR